MISSKYFIVPLLVAGFTACSDKGFEALDDLVTPDLGNQESVEQIAGQVVGDSSALNYLGIPNCPEYIYVMSQFAEFNHEGKFSGRSRFFLQEDPADTTAITTHVYSVEHARHTFLSMLPRENRSQVTVLGDSSEMQYVFGRSPMALTYSEKQVDGHTLAQIGLPAAGPYSGIANSLRMVQAENHGWTQEEENLIGQTLEFKFPVLTSKIPVPYDANYYPDLQYYIKEMSLRMVCYNITPDKMAQFVFLPPSPYSATLKFKKKNDGYLVGAVYPWAFDNNAEKIFGSTKLKEKLFKTLPSSYRVSQFLDIFLDEWIDGTPFNFFFVCHMCQNWWDEDKYIEINNKTGPATDEEFEFYQIGTLFYGLLKKDNVAAQTGRASQFAKLFPYFKDDGYADNKYTLDPFMPLWPDWQSLNKSEGEYDDFVYFRNLMLCSFLTTNYYGRNYKNKIVSDTSFVYTNVADGWTDVSLKQDSAMTDEEKERQSKNTYQYFYQPQQDGFFKLMGRDLKNHQARPLTPLYFYDCPFDEVNPFDVPVVEHWYE